MQPQAVAEGWHVQTRYDLMTFFDIDTGSSGSSGPFISWQAKESNDGSIPGRNWVLRGSEGKSIITDAFKKGVVFDLSTLKTGWCFSTGAAGQAPQWKWNPNLTKFENSPGEGWKKGMSIRIALDKETVGTLEQSSAAMMSMLSDLAALLRLPDSRAATGANKLPVVRMVGVEKVDSKLGTTFIPKIEIVSFIDRPASLGGGGVQIDAGEDVPAKAAPAAAPAPAKKAVVENPEF